MDEDEDDEEEGKEEVVQPILEETITSTEEEDEEQVDSDSNSIAPSNSAAVQFTPTNILSQQYSKCSTDSTCSALSMSSLSCESDSEDLGSVSGIDLF